MSTAATSNNTFKITIVKAVVAIVGILAVAGFAIVALLAVKDSAEVAAPAPAPAGIAEAGGELQALTAPADVDHTELIAAADKEFNAQADKVTAARDARVANDNRDAAQWDNREAEKIAADAAAQHSKDAITAANDASVAFREAYAKDAGKSATITAAKDKVDHAYVTAHGAVTSEDQVAADAAVVTARQEFNATLSG